MTDLLTPSEAEVERLIKGIFGGSVRALLNLQSECEAQGAYSAHLGATRTDCPYSPHILQWEHWVYGNEVEQFRIGTEKGQ